MNLCMCVHVHWGRCPAEWNSSDPERTCKGRLLRQVLNSSAQKQAGWREGLHLEREQAHHPRPMPAACFPIRVTHRVALMVPGARDSCTPIFLEEEVGTQMVLGNSPQISTLGRAELFGAQILLAPEPGFSMLLSHLGGCPEFGFLASSSRDPLRAGLRGRGPGLLGVLESCKAPHKPASWREK